MAVSIGYCTVAQVEALTRPVVSYSTTTKPTLSQVESLIDWIGDQINAEGRKNGLVIPIVEVEAARIAGHTNAYGAAMIVEFTLHHGSQEKDAPFYGDWLKDQFNIYMQKLMGGEYQLATAATNGDRVIKKARRVWSSVKENYDFPDTEPTLESIFKIGDVW